VAAAVSVAAAVTTAKAAVGARLVEQLTVPMPAGHQADDYVATGKGAGFCLVLLVTLALLYLVGWWRVRSASASAAAAPDGSLPAVPQ
jgi:hypothetical protein